MHKALPLAQVGVTRFELEIEILPRGLAGVVLEFDLHVNAVDTMKQRSDAALVHPDPKVTQLKSLQTTFPPVVRMQHTQTRG